MPEIQAERRLVKSPPELWAELSELESLARHLGEFGEIRITRLEPETTVAWEGDELSGTVELEASGWGTKVRLTVATPEEAEPDDPGDPPEDPLDEIEIAEPLAAPAIEASSQPAPLPDPATVAARTAGASIPPPSAQEPDVHSRPRQGWLRRLLRKRHETPAVAPEPVTPGSAGSDGEPRAEAENDYDDVLEAADAEIAIDAGGGSIEDEDGPPPTAEVPGEGGSTRASERAERVESVLAAVLDDLGAAHHRPFSRG